MAYRVLQFQSTIPAGTPIASPVSIALPIDNWEIEAVDLEVPPGPAGLMGFAIFNNNVQWIPYGAGEWIVWDDVQQSWPISGQPNASGWSILGYNLGNWPHSVYTRWHVNPVTQAQPSAQSAPPITIVSSPPPPNIVTL